MKNVKKRNQGFTLVELIIYIAIFMVVISSILGLTWRALSAGTSVRVSSELVQNSRLVFERMSEKVRRAEAVVGASSVFDVNPGKLVLDNGDGDDVTFDTYQKDIDVGGENVSIKKLRMQVGSEDAVDLTSDKVSVENFTLENLTGSAETDYINFDISLDYVNTGDDPDMDKSLSIESGVNTRIQ